MCDMGVGGQNKRGSSGEQGYLLTYKFRQIKNLADAARPCLAE